MLTSALKYATLSGEEEKPEKVIDDLSLKGIAQHIRDGHVKNIVVMAGAGISTGENQVQILSSELEVDFNQFAVSVPWQSFL